MCENANQNPNLEAFKKRLEYFKALLDYETNYVELTDENPYLPLEN